MLRFPMRVLRPQGGALPRLSAFALVLCLILAGGYAIDVAYTWPHGGGQALNAVFFATQALFWYGVQNYTRRRPRLP